MRAPQNRSGRSSAATEIDEEAGRDGKSKDQVEHGLPSHPFDGADAKGKGSKGGKAERQIEKIEHHMPPGGLARMIGPCRVKVLCCAQP